MSMWAHCWNSIVNFQVPYCTTYHVHFVIINIQLQDTCIKNHKTAVLMVLCNGKTRCITTCEGNTCRYEGKMENPLVLVFCDVGNRTFLNVYKWIRAQLVTAGSVPMAPWGLTTHHFRKFIYHIFGSQMTVIKNTTINNDDYGSKGGMWHAGP